MLVCGLVSREAKDFGSDCSGLACMVVTGLLGDWDYPEFSAARTSENDVAVFADVNGVGGKKNFASIVTKIGSRHECLMNARDNSASGDAIFEMWQIELGCVGGAECGTVGTSNTERIAVGPDVGCRGILVKKCVGSASVKTSVFVGLMGWGTATRDMVT